MLRAFDFALSKAALLRTKRDLLKPEVIWNIEEGLKLTVEQLERAEAQRVAMTARTLEFFDKYDLLLCPATIVPPFPVENRYVAECAGKKFDNYVEWLGIVYAITLVCCPALSLPCGFTASGLPIGLQVVAPPRGEAKCWRAPRCWRIFWACAARRRSIRGRQIETRGTLMPRPRPGHGMEGESLAADGSYLHRYTPDNELWIAIGMTSENEPPPESKLTRSKERWAREGKFLTGRISRPEKERLPPGQHLTRDWPMLDLGLTPNIARERWRLDVYGAVENPLFRDFAEFMRAAAEHSSRPTSTASPPGRATTTRGRAAPPATCSTPAGRESEARFVVLHSHDGYTTNLALEDFAAEDAILAHGWSGTPLAQSMAARCGWWCRISTSGKAPNGCSASSFCRRMRRATGRCAAITSAATRGTNSAIQATEDGLTFPDRGFILRDASLCDAPLDEVLDPHGEERVDAARLKPCSRTVTDRSAAQPRRTACRTNAFISPAKAAKNFPPRSITPGRTGAGLRAVRALLHLRQGRARRETHRRGR